MNVHYIKLDMKHADYAATIERLRAAWKAETGNDLGVNANKDGTQAWVKTTADHGVTGPILLADEPEANVAAVAAETSSEAWTGPRRPGRPS